MIKRNRSDCKYVKIFTHHVGCIGAPSRRIEFVRGTNAKRWEVPNTAGRDTKINIFQGVIIIIIIIIIIMHT
jgi:hypothetical protein